MVRLDFLVLAAQKDLSEFDFQLKNSDSILDLKNFVNQALGNYSVILIIKQNFIRCFDYLNNYFKFNLMIAN